MRAKVRALSAPAPSCAWAVAAMAGALALYGQAMAPRILAVLRFGAICTGHVAFAPHCAACYAAALVAGSSLGLLLFAARRGWAAG